MNQKQKIIILLSSFLCGISLIFFSLRSHQNQKNNLSITKKEKKEENINKEKENEIINNQDNQEEDESSSFFWIVVGIIFFLIIVIIIVHKIIKKRKYMSGICGVECNKNRVYINFGPRENITKMDNNFFKFDFQGKQNKIYQDLINSKELNDFYKIITDLLEIIDGYLLRDVYVYCEEEKNNYSFLWPMSRSFIDHLVDKGPNNETFPIFNLSLDTVDSFKKSKSLILYSEDSEKFKDYNSLQLFKLSTTKYIFYTKKNINGQDEKEILFSHSRKIISILRYLNQDLKRFFGKYSEKYKEKYEKYIQICSSVSTFFADINQIEI